MTVFLTLGDGDFSYSLDLVRYLATTDTTPDDKHVVLITGVDTLEDMQDKYKDTDFILKRLQSANCGDKVEVQMYHQVNAVSSDDRSLSADVVIFNHPHLGTEDAARHGRFLHHFLHECNKAWLRSKNGVALGVGTIHLTLAAGQWERWQGETAVRKHGFHVIQRIPFRSPPVENPKYFHRRHQTGKSFHNQTLGSETFVLTKSKENAIAYLFPWQNDKEALKDGDVARFSCAICDRSFPEARSLKSHVKAVHGDSERKRKREFKCCHCELLGICCKVFTHEQSLKDHIQAKHSGLHTKTIKPEWANKNKTPVTTTIDNYGSCPICGFLYQDEGDSLHHMKEFLPTVTLSSPMCESFECQFCKKTFHNTRAQLQHENFCSKRPQVIA